MVPVPPALQATTGLHVTFTFHNQSLAQICCIQCRSMYLVIFTEKNLNKLKTGNKNATTSHIMQGIFMTVTYLGNGHSWTSKKTFLTYSSN